jgi:hypothetical protein
MAGLHDQYGRTTGGLFSPAFLRRWLEHIAFVFLALGVVIHAWFLLVVAGVLLLVGGAIQFGKARASRAQRASPRPIAEGLVLDRGTRLVAVAAEAR